MYDLDPLDTPKPVAFSIDLSPGRHRLAVTYSADAMTHRVGEPTVVRQFAYVLAPARDWAAFGGLDVRVHVPPGWRAAAAPALERDGDVLRGTFADLPADSLALTIQAPAWAHDIIRVASLRWALGLGAAWGAGAFAIGIAAVFALGSRSPTASLSRPATARSSRYCCSVVCPRCLVSWALSAPSSPASARRSDATHTALAIECRRGREAGCARQLGAPEGAAGSEPARAEEPRARRRLGPRLRLDDRGGEVGPVAEANRRRVWVEHEGPARLHAMPAMILEHVEKRAANLGRALERPPMMAIAPHFAFAPKKSVQPARERNGESAHTTTQGFAVRARYRRRRRDGAAPGSAAVGARFRLCDGLGDQVKVVFGIEKCTTWNSAAYARLRCIRSTCLNKFRTTSVRKDGNRGAARIVTCTDAAPCGEDEPDAGRSAADLGGAKFYGDRTFLLNGDFTDEDLRAAEAGATREGGGLDSARYGGGQLGVNAPPHVGSPARVLLRQPRA